MIRGPRTYRKASRRRSRTRNAVVAPLILIIRCNEIGRGVPVLTLNRPEKVLGVTPHLPLWLPQPDEIEPCAKSDDQPATKTFAKRNRHSELSLPATQASRPAEPVMISLKMARPAPLLFDLAPSLHC